MKKTNDDIMSEDDSHLNLDKDDEDYLEFEIFKPKKEDKSYSDKSKKSGKKWLDLTGFENPIFSLFRKHSRSSFFLIFPIHMRIKIKRNIKNYQVFKSHIYKVRKIILKKIIKF